MEAIIENKSNCKQHKDQRFAGKNAQEWSAILGVYRDAVSKFARYSGSFEAAVWYCAGMVDYDLVSYLITGKGQFAERKRLSTLMCDDLPWYSWCEKNKVPAIDFAMRFYQFKSADSAMAWSESKDNDISRLTAYKKSASYWADALGVELSVLKFTIINHQDCNLREAIYRLAYQKRIPIDSLFQGQSKQVNIQEEPVSLDLMLKPQYPTIDKYRIAARAFTAERTKEVISLTDDDWNKILDVGEYSIQKAWNCHRCGTLTAVFYLSLVNGIDIDVFIKDGVIKRCPPVNCDYKNYSISDWSTYLKVSIGEFIDVAFALKSVEKAAEYLGYQGEELPHIKGKVPVIKNNNELPLFDDKGDEKEDLTMKETEEMVKENDTECTTGQLLQSLFAADIDELFKAYKDECGNMAASMDQTINWARVMAEKIFDAFKTNALDHTDPIMKQAFCKMNDMLNKANKIIAAKDTEIKKLREQLDVKNSEVVCPEWDKITYEFPNATPELILAILHGREAERTIGGSRNN